MKDLTKLRRRLLSTLHKEYNPTILILDRVGDEYILSLDNPETLDTMEQNIPVFKRESPDACEMALYEWVKRDVKWLDRYRYLSDICPIGAFIILGVYDE